MAGEAEKILEFSKKKFSMSQQFAEEEERCLSRSDAHVLQDAFSTILKVRGKREVMDIKLTLQRKEGTPIQRDDGREGRDKGSVQSKKYENRKFSSHIATYTLVIQVVKWILRSFQRTFLQVQPHHLAGDQL